MSQRQPYRVAVIPGDGIGPEMIEQAIRVLKQVSAVFHQPFSIEYCVAGLEAIHSFGKPLPDHSLELCRQSDAILMGNMSLGQYPHLAYEERPEYALMLLRKELGLQTNLRPASIIPELIGASPLREEIARQGLDILMVRDISGGIIMSQNYTGNGPYGREAFEKEYYNEQMIRNTARWAFYSARKRRRKVTSIDKAVVLSSSALWREVVNEVAADYPDVELDHMYADDAALQLVQNPSQFDVMVASNLFGDILSDEIAGLCGTPNILPAASIDSTGKGIFGPNQLHNKDDSIVGKNIANPIGLIHSIAMMLSYAFDMAHEAQAVQDAVKHVLSEGYATRDIYEQGKTLLGTEAIGDLIVQNIKEKSD